MRLIFLRTGEWNDNAEIFYKLAVPPFEYVERSPKVQRVRLSNIQINDSPAFSFVRSSSIWSKKKKKPGSSYLFPNALDITKKKKKKEHRSTECFSILLTPIIINDYDKKL